MRTYTPLRLLIAAGALTVVGFTTLWTGRAYSSPKDTAPTGKITPWAAMKIATGKVPGKAINATFEYEEAHWIYAVMVVTNATPKTIREVEIDANTGKIGDTEEITPEGEAKEMTSEMYHALGKTPPKDANEKDEKNEKPGKSEKGEKGE